MKAIRIADSLDNPGEKLVRIRHDHIEHSVPMAEAEELITDLIRLGVPCRVAEALLRQNDSAIAVGNDCEIARRGTTAELAKYVAVAQSEQETVLDAWLRRAREAEEQLAEIQETTRRVMTEECAPDEKHCTCVPILRTQLAEQQRVGLFLQAAHGQALQERDAERARMDARDNDVDTEQARWQDAIYKLLLKRVSGTNQIDGGGCESGDPLDLTLTEIAQAINLTEERTEQALTKLRAALTDEAAWVFAQQRGGRVVWESLCANIQRQGRHVADQRLSWEILPAQDKELNAMVSNDVLNDFAAWLREYAGIPDVPVESSAVG